MTSPAEVEIDDLVKTAVYRLYDAEGALLYVGVTDNLRTRLATHAREKSWWPLVAKKTVVWYDARKEALAAETQAILCESPVHNAPRPVKQQKRRTERKRRTGVAADRRRAQDAERNKQTILSVRTSAGFPDRVKATAEARGMSVSAFVTETLEKWFQRQDASQQDKEEDKELLTPELLPAEQETGDE